MNRVHGANIVVVVIFAIILFFAVGEEKEISYESGYKDGYRHATEEVNHPDAYELDFNAIYSLGFEKGYNEGYDEAKK